MSSNPFSGPSIGQGRPTPLPGNQGSFHLPTTVQRMAEQTYYSTYHLVGGAALQLGNLFFSTPVNQQGQGFTFMTVSETNLAIGSQNPGDITFDVSSMSCEVMGARSVNSITGISVPDLRVLQRVGIFSWAFGGAANTSRIGIAPLSMIGAGGGIYGATADTGTPTTFANNGNGSIWFYSRVVIVLPAFQTYNVVLDCGGAGTNSSLVLAADTDIRFNLFNQVRQALPIA